MLNEPDRRHTRGESESMPDADPAAPEITVAIPTYNGARHLGSALDGILAQTVPFDLLVCDDRSDDDTAALVRDRAGDRARVEVNGERLGLAGNWNRCVTLSRTPWVAVFHQDDVMRPGHLAAHLAAAHAHPDAGLIASAAGVIDDAGREVPASVVGRGGCGPLDRFYAPGEFLEKLAAANPLRCSGVTTRRDAHRAVGGFDPRYRYVVDWDFWARVARSWPVAWLARPTVAIRWHLASETHRFRAGVADLDETAAMLDALRADPQSGPIAGRHRRAADRILARAFLNRAYDASKAGHPGQVRECLRRAIGLDRGVWKAIARDPRLAFRLVLGLRPKGGA